MSSIINLYINIVASFFLFYKKKIREKKLQSEDFKKEKREIFMEKKIS